MSTQANYEYEERAFLNEEEFFRVQAELDKISLSREFDNKTSYFFVLPDKNLSLASGSKKTVIKYKHGAVGAGNGFKEYEIPVDLEVFGELVDFFEHLLGIKPQISEQFRINYTLSNHIEVALKYTQTWGFHLELEMSYAKEEKLPLAQSAIIQLADSLKIKLLTREDLMVFRKHIDSGGNGKGGYSPNEFRKRFGKLFSIDS